MHVSSKNSYDIQILLFINSQEKYDYVQFKCVDQVGKIPIEIQK